MVKPKTLDGNAYIAQHNHKTFEGRLRTTFYCSSNCKDYIQYSDILLSKMVLPKLVKITKTILLSRLLLKPIDLWYLELMFAQENFNDSWIGGHYTKLNFI